MGAGMIFEPLKDVSVCYRQRESDGQGQITVSYQRSDDVNRVVVVYLDARQLPIENGSTYFIRPNDGTEISLGIGNPPNGIVEEQSVFVCGLRTNGTLGQDEFIKQYSTIQNRSEMIYSVLVGKAIVEYCFREYDSELYEYKLEICYKTQAECEIPGKFLCYSYRYCGVKFEFPINDNIGKEKKSYYIRIPSGAKDKRLEAVRTQSIHIKRIEVKEGIFQKFIRLFKKQ